MLWKIKSTFKNDTECLRFCDIKYNIPLQVDGPNEENPVLI